MMKKLLMISVALLALAGCRREDIREYTLELPMLTAADKRPITEALAKYGGIDRSSLVFDLEKKTLTLRYDSMQIAKTNIRMAIDEKLRASGE